MILEYGLGGTRTHNQRLNKARLAGLLRNNAIVWKNILYLDSDVTLLCVKPDWMIRDFISCTYRGLRRCDSGPAQNFFDCRSRDLRRGVFVGKADAMNDSSTRPPIRWWPAIAILGLSAVATSVAQL